MNAFGTEFLQEAPTADYGCFGCGDPINYAPGWNPPRYAWEE